MRGVRLVVARRKAEKVFKHYEGYNPRNLNQNGFRRLRCSKDDMQRLLGIYRKTKVSCSCYTCGNPRRWWGYLPIREVKQHIDADFQYEEFGWNYRKLRWLKGWLD